MSDLHSQESYPEKWLIYYVTFEPRGQVGKWAALPPGEDCYSEQAGFFDTWEEAIGYMKRTEFMKQRGKQIQAMRAQVLAHPNPLMNAIGE